MVDVTLHDESEVSDRPLNIGVGYRPRQLVANRYEVVKRLGSGGMGVVYEVADQVHDERVALKTLRGFEAQALYRFKHEFRSLADVTHRNLVRLHELVIEDEHAFFTMELVDGQDLMSYVREGAPPGTLPNLARVRLALRQLVDGVATLHRAGKLHRDIKPPNVLVTKEGRVVLLDFGLVHELHSDALTATGRVLGTPTYMSPEQALGKELTGASDYYSIGVVLYRLLTGRLPFEGGARKVLKQKLKSEPPPPSTHVPDLPRDFDELCMALLHRVPSSRIGAPELLRRLGRAPIEIDTSLTPRVGDAPFVGREREMGALREAFGRVRRGNALTMLLPGRSGVGKSMLISRFLGWVREGDRALTLSGRCLDREAMAYKGLDGLVDSLSQHLARLDDEEAAAVVPRHVRALARVFPVLDRVHAIRTAPEARLDEREPQAVRRLAFAALRELLGAIADRRPLVVHVDDVQWSDRESIELLAELVRPPDAPAALVLLSYRPNHDVPSLELLETHRKEYPAQFQELPVRPLSHESAAQLASELIEGHATPQQELPQTIARESRGNPLHLSELVRAMAHEEDEMREALRDGLTPTPWYERTLDELVIRRLARLEDDARELLEVVSVARGPLDANVAFAAAHVRDGEPLVNTLMGEKLLRQDRVGLQVEAMHDRIREIVVGRLGSSHLRGCHRRLAVALEAAGADPEVLCEHFRLARDWERASEYARAAAAGASEALAFERAVDLYRRSLELLGSSDTQDVETVAETRQDIQLALADALSSAGRGPDAAEVYVSLLPRAEASRARDLRRRAAEQLLRSGHLDRGLAALREVLDSVRLRPTTSRPWAIAELVMGRLWLRLRGTRFRARTTGEIPEEVLDRVDACWSVVHGLAAVHPVRGAAFQNRHLRLALKCGEPVRVGRALSFEALFVGAIPRDLPWARRMLDQAERIGTEHRDAHVLALARLIGGALDMLHCQWKGANAKATDALERLEGCVDVSWEQSLGRQIELISLLYLGELGELASRLPAVVEGSQSRGDLLALVQVSTLASQARLAADDVEGATQMLVETVDRWSQAGFNAPDFLRVAGYSQIELYRGRGRSAHQRWQRAWKPLERSLMLQSPFMRFMALDHRGRAALMAARDSASPEDLLAGAESDARQMRRTGMAPAHPAADVICAGLAAARGDRAVADECYQRAEAGFDAADMGLHAAAVRWRRGRLVGGERGRALEADGLGAMLRQGVRNPERWVDMHVPSGVRAAVEPANARA